MWKKKLGADYWAETIGHSLKHPIIIALLMEEMVEGNNCKQRQRMSYEKKNNKRYKMQFVQRDKKIGSWLRKEETDNSCWNSKLYF